MLIIIVPPVLSSSGRYLTAASNANLNLANRATIATPTGPKAFFTLSPKLAFRGGNGDGVIGGGTDVNSSGGFSF